MRHWKHRLVIVTYRTLRWGQRYLPPGIRTVVGLMLMVGGVFGFLPILGFWMLPLGVAIASLDFPPLRRRLEKWLIDTRRRYHIQSTAVPWPATLVTEREDVIPATPIPLVIGVTGHRDLVEHEVPMLERRVLEFFENLRTRYPNVPLEVLSPLAEGADRLVARIALDLGIRVIAPLPMLQEHYLEDFASPESRDEFDALVTRARVFALPEWSLPGAPAKDAMARELRYAQMGVFIASHCHILLTLWDGRKSEQIGGTAQVVAFHQRDFMPGISEQREGLTLNLVNDESDLVYHVACSRQQTGNSPVNAQPGEVCWFTLDESNPRTRSLPGRYDRVFRRIAEFNADAGANADTIERDAWTLSSEGDPIPTNARRIEEAFKVADWLAIRFQRRNHAALRAMLGCALAAGFCFVAFADLPGQDLMIYPYLGFFSVGIAVYFVQQHGGWHRRYLDYRVLAESLRVQFYWAVAGVTPPTPTKYSHDSYLSKQDVELGWIRHVMRFTGRRADALIEIPGIDSLEFAGPQWIDDQREYYGRSGKQRAIVHQRNSLVGSFCLWLGTVIAVVLALVQFSLTETLKAPLMALMGLLPLIAGIRAVYSHKKADLELIKQYGFMHRIMTEAMRRWRIADSDDDRREILRALGETALDEFAEWIMRQRERRPDSQELG